MWTKTNLTKETKIIFQEDKNILENKNDQLGVHTMWTKKNRLNRTRRHSWGKKWPLKLPEVYLFYNNWQKNAQFVIEGVCKKKIVSYKIRKNLRFYFLHNISIFLISIYLMKHVFYQLSKICFIFIAKNNTLYNDR